MHLTRNILHCCLSTLPSLLTILAGSQDSVSGDQWYNVSQNVAHPSYGPDLFDYNFALLQITGKFDWSETVRSINLPEKAAQLGSKALIVGWGASKTVIYSESITFSCVISCVITSRYEETVEIVHGSVLH